MKRFILALLAMVMLAAPAAGFVITLTGDSNNTLGNFTLPCSSGKTLLWVPALGGAKTLTVRAYTSDNTALYGNVYTSQGSMTQSTYTTPNNAAFAVDVTWGAGGALMIDGTNKIGYNILVSDNSAIGKTAYVIGSCP